MMEVVLVNLFVVGLFCILVDVGDNFGGGVFGDYIVMFVVLLVRFDLCSVMGMFWDFDVV